MHPALLQADLLIGAGSRFWLWFTWGGMTFATVAFLYLATQGGPRSMHHYVTSAVITLWAALSYVVMATGSGVTTVIGDQGVRLFYYVRYIDWTVTTPLLLLGLAWVAMGGSIRRNPRVVGILVGADVLMILTGLVAGSIGGGFRWFWFLVSSAFFAVVLYYIWFAPDGLAAQARSGAPEGGPGLFFTLASMLTVLWFLYPVVWLLGSEGVGALGSGAEVFFFALLDILAKVAFGFVLLGGIRRTQQA